MRLSVGGGLQGAGTGAGIGGSIGGGPGAAIGAGIGGVYGLLGGGQNTPNRLKSYDPVNPQQRSYSNQLLQNAGAQNGNIMQYLNDILSDNPEAFKAFENPAMSHFQQQVLPAIAERFAGLGAGSSSALNQTLGEAGNSLEQALSSQRQQLKDQALRQLLNMGQLGLSGSQTPYMTGGQEGLFSQLAPAAAQGVQTMAQRGDFNNTLDWLKNKLGGTSQPATSAGVTSNFAMPARQQLPSFQDALANRPSFGFKGFI